MSGDYASFGYLDDEPAAFARFPLAKESGRVPAYDGGFDAATVARAENLLAQHIVVSLHDLGLAARFADRVVVLAGGKVAADGPAAIALQPDVIDAAYGVGFRTVTIDGIVQPVAWSRQP